MPLFGSGESKEQKRAREAHVQWAKATLKRHSKEFRGDGYWRDAKKAFERLLERPENAQQAVLVRSYTHRDPKDVARMMQIEANVLAELGYTPTSQAWATAKPATALLGGIGMLAPQTLTVTYERRPASPGHSSMA